MTFSSWKIVSQRTFGMIKTNRSRFSSILITSVSLVIVASISMTMSIRTLLMILSKSLKFRMTLLVTLITEMLLPMQVKLERNISSKMTTMWTADSMTFSLISLVRCVCAEIPIDTVNGRLLRKRTLIREHSNKL